MTKVNLETIFIDVIDEVLDFVPEADHYQLLGQIVQKLTDDGYNLKVLYGHNDELDDALNHIYEEDSYEDD